MATISCRRASSLVLPLALLVGVFCTPAAAAGSRHPHFNDRGTLSWHHTLAEAQQAAQRQGKVIFVEFGRKKCTNCRKLAQDVLPHRKLRGRLSATAVGLAAECDKPEAAVVQLFRTNMPNARVLPFVAFLTPDGRWITGWFGSTSVDRVSAHLATAERYVRALRAADCRPKRAVGRTAPAMRGARREKPQPRVYPAPPPSSERPRSSAHKDDDGGGNSACVGGNCGVPSLELPCLPNPLKLLTRGCKPQPCPPKPCRPQPCPPKARPAAASQATRATPPPPCPSVPLSSVRVLSPAPAPRPAAPACVPVKKAAPISAQDSAPPVPFTIESRTATVADLAREAAARVQWADAWQMFRRASDSVDAQPKSANTP